MKLKYILVSVITFFFLFSELALAKKPEGKGNSNHGRPNARWENSNKQSDEYSLRGKDRAEERHRLKESKKYKQKKGKKLKYKKEKHYGDYSSKHDQYEIRRNQEKYRNNPIVPIIDQGANSAKTIIDQTHRRAIESIDNKTRELTGIDTPKDRTKPAKRWYWPFGD